MRKKVYILFLVVTDKFVFFILQNNKEDDRALALLDSTPSSTARALRLDRMTLTHPGAMLDDPREFRRSDASY